MSAAVEVIEFEPPDFVVVVDAMTELADGGGWLTLDPAVDDRFPPPPVSLLGRLLSGRGPVVPRATWVPAQLERRRREPVSVGVLHGTGSGAVARLADKGVAVPDRWRIAADHSKRGLVAWVPIDIEDADVVTWTVDACRALTRIPLDGRWRVAIHRT